MTTFNAPSHADDMQQVVRAVHSLHDPEMIQVACTQLLCNRLLEQYEQQHGFAVAAMVGTLARLVDAYAESLGLSSFDVMDIQASIDRAHQSMAYIAAIPSDADIAAALAPA